MSKKILSIIMMVALVLTCCSCGKSNPEGGDKPDTPVEYSQVASGKNGVVAAADPTAAQVGIDVLKAGGNAADAIVAAAFALGLTENAASGIGSTGFMLYYDAASGKTTAVNYDMECPAGMTLSDFTDSTGTRDRGMGGLRAVVPGFIAGMSKVNELFGTKTLAELIAPTIKMAEEGVAVTSFMAENYRDYYDRMQLYPETARVFLNDGLPYGEGDIFKNPDLASALKKIAENGKDAFYTGEIAEAIVESQRATGSKITMEDLARYEARVQEPVVSTYHGYKIVSMPCPASGSIVISALNLAEHFDIANMERNSLEYIHTWSEISRVAISDYSTYIDDPNFNDLSGARGLLTKEYAAERVKLIKPDSTIQDGVVGDAASFDPESHTTHLSVIDKDGNIATMTNTNGDFFGTLTTVTDFGFVVQNTSTFASGVPGYQPQAGKQGRTPMSPTLVFNPDGTPYAAIGTPGSMRIISTIAEIISNMIDYGMDLKTAVDAPRVFQGRTGGLYVEGGFNKEYEEQLRALGHDVTFRVEHDSYFGGAHCIYIDSVTGEKTGAADCRRSGVAIAY